MADSSTQIPKIRKVVAYILDNGLMEDYTVYQIHDSIIIQGPDQKVVDKLTTLLREEEKEG